MDKYIDNDVYNDMDEGNKDAYIDEDIDKELCNISNRYIENKEIIHTLMEEATTHEYLLRQLNKKHRESAIKNRQVDKPYPTTSI